MTRDGSKVKVYLNGNLEIDGQLSITYPEDCSQFQIGGRNDNFANLQGMLDEVSLFDRVLSPEEIQMHFQASGAKRIDKPMPEKKQFPRPTSPE